MRIRFVLSVLYVLSVASCGGGVPYGKVGFGRLEIDGVVDQGYLEQQLGQLEPRFQACYASALRRNRSSEGRIGLSVQGGGGRLAARVTENTTADDFLTGCVTRAIDSLRIVERPGSGPWAFTASWTVAFEIAKPRERRSNG